MDIKNDLTSLPTPRKFYVKRKQFREDYSKDASSIFAPSQAKAFESFSLVDDAKKYQTVTTAIQNTMTLNSNNQDHLDDEQLTQRMEKNDFLPKINLMLNSKLSRSNQQTKQSQIKTKAMSCHLSDPHYLRLEKTLLKRANNKHGEYKKGWNDFCQRRKQKSVVERSLQKAALSIEYINLDARKRKNTTDLSEMLRNNIAQKTFIFPGKIRPDIEGLKGKGGKVVPIFSEVFLIQEVYKYDKKNKNTVE